MIYENQVIFHKKCVRGLNYDVHGYRLTKRYYITPEFTVLRCFATPKSIPKLKTLITSALTEFFYVNIYVFFCCILLRFT